jgi:hypothetical protein
MGEKAIQVAAGHRMFDLAFPDRCKGEAGIYYKQLALVVRNP